MHMCQLLSLCKMGQNQSFGRIIMFHLQLNNSLELLIPCRELKILYNHNSTDNRVKRCFLTYLVASFQDLALFFTTPPPKFFSRLLIQEANQIPASLSK